MPKFLISLLAIFSYAACISSSIKQNNTTVISSVESKIQYEVMDWVFNNYVNNFIDKDVKIIGINDKLYHWKPFYAKKTSKKDYLGIKNVCNECEKYSLDTLDWYKPIVSNAKDRVFHIVSNRRDDEGTLFFSPIIKTKKDDVFAIQINYLSFDENYYSFILVKRIDENNYLIIKELEGVIAHN